MRTHRALALIVLSGILTACGQPGATPGGATATGWFSYGTPRVTQGDLVLEAVLTSGRSQHPTAGQQLGLVVEYTISNNGSEPMLLHDRVPPTLGSATLPENLTAERVWVYLADGRIRLSKQGFSPAPGVRFIATPVMGARVLEPQQRLSGRAWAPLPPTLDVPGAEFDAPRTALDPKTAAVQEWEFCVQVTAGSQGRPSDVDASVVEVPATAPSGGELVCSSPWALPPGAFEATANTAATPVAN